MGEWGKKFREWLLARGMEIASEAETGLPTVVALPPPRAREFLRERAPALALELDKVEMLPVVSVTCFFPDSASSFRGFGCLFPRSEGFRVLGVLANHCIFPERAKPGWISETWIFGGATGREIIKLSDEELLALIETEREKIFGLEAKIQSAEISRWSKAIPHYNLALESFTARRAGDYILFGTYLGDLGLARVLFQAKKLARSFR
jgi:protoporphyrinogen oxidase